MIFPGTFGVFLIQLYLFLCLFCYSLDLIPSPCVFRFSFFLRLISFCFPLLKHFCPNSWVHMCVSSAPRVCHPSGSYLTHEASGLDEQGEAREAFLNGSDGHKRKEEFFI